MGRTAASGTMKVLPVAALLILGTTRNNAENPLKVTLFYESYCPYCCDYIQLQVKSAWNTFRSSGAIRLDLLPFGNTFQKYVDGHWVFDCQHGPQECVANKLHACAILQACGEGGTVSCDVNNLSHVVNYIDCVTKESDQLVSTIKCAKSEGLKSQEILECADNETGERLLNIYGNITMAFRPKIAYVPSVAINGKHNQEAEKNLTAEICKLRPSLCHQPEPIVLRI